MPKISKIEIFKKKLNEFRTLKRGWDSAGAEPVKGTDINVALKWLNTFPNMAECYDEVAPDPHGGIQFTGTFEGNSLDLWIGE